MKLKLSPGAVNTCVVERADPFTLPLFHSGVFSLYYTLVVLLFLYCVISTLSPFYSLIPRPSEREPDSPRVLLAS